MRQFNIIFGTYLFLVMVPSFAQSTSVESLIAQGDKYWEAGEKTLAEQSFQSALESNEQSVPAHFKLALVYLSQQRFAESVSHLQRVIGLDSGNAKAFAILGIAYWHRGDYGLAQAALKEATKLDPQLDGAKKLLALINQKLGNR